MLDPDTALRPAPGPESKNSFALARLRRAFVACELLPGGTAAEAEIAERFGLGRAAVRTALARLEAEGFVSVAPRAGWMVVPITGSSVGDVVATWRMFARGLAAATVPPETVRALANIASQADALAGRTEIEVLAATRKLWRSFMAELAASQGSLVAGWIGRCNDLTQRLTHWFERSNPRWIAPRLGPVTDRLAAGDMAGASAALEQISLQLRDWLISCLIRAEDMVLTPTPERTGTAPGRGLGPGTVTTPDINHKKSHGPEWPGRNQQGKS